MVVNNDQDTQFKPNNTIFTAYTKTLVDQKFDEYMKHRRATDFRPTNDL